MDNNPIIKLARDCDELMLHNFEKIKETGNLAWLIIDYDGWEKIEVPKEASEHWSNILNEYAGLTDNNTTVQYFDMLVDISDAKARVTSVEALLKQLSERPLMKKEIKDEYIKELNKWRFYYNKSKNHKEEMKRLYKQLELVLGKLRMAIKEKEQLEGKFGKSDLMTVIVKVQNVLMRTIDKRKISVKEWVYTLKNLPKSNNG